MDHRSASRKYSLAPYHQFVNHQFVNAQERLTIITLGRDGHRIRMTILTAWTTCISTGADTSGHVYCRLVVVNLYLNAMSELRLKCWNCGSTPQPEQYNHFDGHWSLLIWFHYYFLSEPQFWHFNRNSDILPPAEKNVAFWGVKHKKSWPNFFCGSWMHIKNTFCKKIGSKRPFQPSAVVKTIYRRS